jgi:hypothetical protein
MSLTENIGIQGRTALEARALSKHYGKVRALKPATSRSRPAASSPWSERMAPASRR